MNTLAERYVKLVLALGEHDENYVDAYFGPEAWRASAREAFPSLDSIAVAARDTLSELGRLPPASEPLEKQRANALTKRLTALAARLDMLRGRHYTFDEETRLLYDAVAPHYEDAYFQAIIDELDALLPGGGSIEQRAAEFRSQFVVPPARLSAVFDAAIAECRRRTLQRIALPVGERFTVEYVTGKPWSGYNWYQGSAVSLIQINTSLPVYIDRAVDLGCHEGYPGHHTQNALLEQHLYRERGWPEYLVYALFSPQSPIAEGTANYGIALAFPGEERLQFETQVLYPLAGLDGAQVERYQRFLELRQRLSYARNEAARAYLDGRESRDQAAEWLQHYALMTPEEAEHALAFIETYRSYVINYNLGQDVVEAYVARLAGDGSERRWEVFTEILSRPVSMSDLQ